MPYRSLRKCTYPGCNTLVKSGRCPTHAKQWDKPRDIKHLYNSKQWRELRAQHLAKYPNCVDCGIPATDADHIIPHKGDDGLFFDPANLQSKCHAHHSSKTAREVWHRDTPRQKKF